VTLTRVICSATMAIIAVSGVLAGAGTLLLMWKVDR
jgi:hypothetical protein